MENMVVLCLNMEYNDVKCPYIQHGQVGLQLRISRFRVQLLAGALFILGLTQDASERPET